MNAYIENVIKTVERRDAEKPEYIQCVREVLGSLEKVIEELRDQDYTEFTVGVEDDNDRARHIYEKFGFTKFLSRKSEEYQGNKYEYDLILLR